MIKAVRQKKRRRQRLFFVGLLVILLAAAGGTLHRLSLSLHDISRIIQLAAGKISDTDKVVPPKEVVLRGTIYDRHFNELSVSYQLFTLYVHPVELTDRHQAAADIAAIIGRDSQSLSDRLKNVQPVIELADDLDKQQAADIAALHIDGVYCKPREERYYPAHTAAAHFLGFADNSIGLTGVEALYDPVLHPGVFRKSDAPEIDFGGAESLGRTTTDVVLTLDIALQKKIEHLLEEYRRETGAARGMALVMNPTNGNVLAVVSQPGFDPNYFWNADDQRLEGQAFRPKYGKDLVRSLLVTSAAIYDAGLNGDVLPPTVRAPEYGMNREKLDQYWKLFGFDQPVQCRLPADKVTASVDKSGPGKQDRLSGVQLAVGLASLMNGGSRVTPEFFSSIYDHAERKMHFLDRSVNEKSRIIPPADGVHLRRELAAQPFFNSREGFIFTGKVEKAERDNGLTAYSIQELLVAAVPRDRPEVLLLMAVDYGGLYPLVPGKSQKKKRKKKTKTKTKNLAAIGRTLLPVLAVSGSSESSQKHPVAKSEDNYQRFLISRRLDLPETKQGYVQVEKLMPELTGLSLRKGLQRISAFNLDVSIKGSGRIVAQNPAPGEPLSKRASCRLTLESRI
jgi:cell division protein FtsI (penicillin-binding protein 3)